MKTPHVHAEVIKAWADGAQIQVKAKHSGSEWEDLNGIQPTWYLEQEYRVKPEPMPDIIKYFHTNIDENTGKVYVTPQFYSTYSNIKVVFDGDTCELKSVELIK